jgi:hypothetical protein
MRIGGVDPGKSGAVAIVEDGKIVEMALLVDVIPRSWFERYGCSLVWVEHAQSFPRQGIASAFNYGRDFGYLLGSLAGSGIFYHLIRSAAWTSKIHAMSPKMDDPKDRSLWCAKHIWPEQTFLATDKSKKPHDGLIDAALIAYYGYLVHKDKISGQPLVSFAPDKDQAFAFAD